jgi:hypothetical protein
MWTPATYLQSRIIALTAHYKIAGGAAHDVDDQPDHACKGHQQYPDNSIVHSAVLGIPAHPNQQANIKDDDRYWNKNCDNQ